jgi:hypothetical protein
MHYAEHVLQAILPPQKRSSKKDKNSWTDFSEVKAKELFKEREKPVAVRELSLKSGPCNNPRAIYVVIPKEYQETSQTPHF